MKGKKMMGVLILAALSGFGLGVYAGFRAPSGQRAIPMLIPYQGVLERNGQLVNSIDAQTVGFRVSLWDAPTGGNKVWPAEADTYDEHNANVYNGRFAFEIGSDYPYEHVPNSPLYLDIQVKGPDDADYLQLGGRQRFMSAPFAIAAQRSDTGFLVGTDLEVTGTTNTHSLDVTTGTNTASLDVSGTASANRLDANSLYLNAPTTTTCNTSSGDNFNQLKECTTISPIKMLGWREYWNWNATQCTHWGDLPRCTEMTSTKNSACFLSMDHVLCEVRTRADKFYLVSDTSAHSRQCRAICLMWE